jgi:hypothetical protein
MEKKIIKDLNPDFIDILDDDNFENQTSNAVFQEIEELDDNAIPSVIAERFPLPRRSSVWGNADLSQKIFWPVEIDHLQSQRSPAITSQTGEKDYQWFCFTTEKTTPRSRISNLVPIYWAEKLESFSPNFYDIRNVAKTLISSIYTESSGDIPSILAVSETHRVIEEAKAEKIVEDLEIAIELIRRIYSPLKEIKLDVKYDPEIANRKTFCFTLTVSGDLDAILKNESLFKRELLSVISYHACELIVITYNWEK